jgi:predicted helicase
MPSIFPDNTVENRVIMIKQRWSGDGQLALMVDKIVELQSDGGTQCFPIYVYGPAEEEEETESSQDDMFSEAAAPEPRRRDAITDAALKQFTEAYPSEEITKEDIFYYVYGLLHSVEYRERYADNLSKELPRIPRVKTAKDFWTFSRSGRDLGDLHVDYESVEPYPVTIKQGDLRTAVIDDPDTFYRVTKMKFGGKRGEIDKTTVIYNANITMQNVPLEAYDYVVNGKPALEWVMERQCVKVDKESGIVNDANCYAIETVGDPAYPLELFQRLITVSLETLKIVRMLPELDIVDAAMVTVDCSA